MMTSEEEGAYIRLLCYCWDSGDCSLPNDDTKLSIMSRLNERWFNGGSTTLKKCFIPHPEKDGFLTNQRLYDEMLKQRAWSDKSSEGGKKSALKRAEKKQLSKGGSKMVATKSNVALASASSFASKEEESKYRFAASVIKLSEKDYLQLKKTYNAIPDFDAELLAADQQYSREPPGNWFCALGNRLNVKHQSFLSKQKAKPKEKANVITL